MNKASGGDGISAERNTRLDEAEAGIKTARRNTNNLRYADDTTRMAKSEEQLKSLLMNVKIESEKVGLKFNIQKTKIMASGPITSWKIDGETIQIVRDFFGGAPKSLQMVTIALEEKYDQLRQHIKKQRHYFANKDQFSQSYGFFQWSCMDVRIGLQRKLSAKELMLLNCAVGEDS